MERDLEQMIVFEEMSKDEKDSKIEKHQDGNIENGNVLKDRETPKEDREKVLEGSQ